MAITYAQETGLTAEDYVGVIGQTIMRDGERTGALPGKLMRGPQPAPV